MLVVFAPGSRTRILERRIVRRMGLVPERGDIVRVERKKLRVTRIHMRVDRHGDRIEHVTEIYTRAIARTRRRRVELASNVVRMPTGDNSVVAEFLRYHVLIRAFDGDPDAWLAHLREGGGNDGDIRFVRRLRSRLRKDPFLLIAIRKMVDETPFWRAAEA